MKSIILYKEVTGRYITSPIYLYIFCHVDNILNKDLSINEKEFVEKIIKFSIIDEIKLFKIKKETLEFYVEYLKIQDFWYKFFKQLPRVKLDNRIQLGEYKIKENIYLIVRDSERFKNQYIEIIIKK